MTSESIRRVLGRFGKVRVLVIGDLMLDQFIWGRVDRISPEAPVPVVRVTDESFRPGGAANVAHNLGALGGRVEICGLVGSDEPGRRLLQLLRHVKASVSGVITTRSVTTIQKTRIVAHQQQVVRLDREGMPRRLAAVEARLRANLARQCAGCDVAVVSDYGKGVVSPAILADLAALRGKHGFHLVIDPKKHNFAYYRGASLVTPNMMEAGQAAGVDIDDPRSLRRVGEILLERWQSDAVLITRGEHGMTLFKRNGEVTDFPTVARHVYDVTGAGDTVVATCALALGAGATLEEATVLANHAAGMVVGEVGTATVTLADLRAEMRRSPAVRRGG